VSTVAVWTPPTAQERLAILRRTRTVAMVGASANPSRASNFVATYLLAESNFDLWFVNPTVESILGRPVYPSLAALPDRPDLVEVFRRPDELMGVADDAIAAGARTLWLQLRLWDEAVADHAAAAGLEVVMNRCLKIEHARFRGGLHLAGFDTGVLTSRRTRAI
jgi:predicted CoA-binding protein